MSTSNYCPFKSLDVSSVYMLFNYLYLLHSIKWLEIIVYRVFIDMMPKIILVFTQLKQNKFPTKPSVAGKSHKSLTRYVQKPLISILS